jgi:hypothetical protein
MAQGHCELMVLQKRVWLNLGQHKLSPWLQLIFFENKQVWMITRQAQLFVEDDDGRV